MYLPASLPRARPLQPVAQAPVKATPDNNVDLQRLSGLAAKFSHEVRTAVKESAEPLSPDILVKTVDMDGSLTCVATSNHALGTTAVGPCVAACVRGVNAAGQTVLGLAHISSIEAEGQLYALAERMSNRGATECELFLVGGTVSLAVALTDADDQTHWLEEPMKLAEPEHVFDDLGVIFKLAGLALGLSESHWTEHRGRAVMATTGRPSGVSVVITSKDVVYRAEHPGQAAFFNEATDRNRLALLTNCFQCFGTERIHKATGPLPPSIRVLHDVAMDQVQTCIVESGEALGTSGVNTCVALCARGPNLQGQTVLGLMHAASLNPGSALETLGHAMKDQGVTACDLFLVGGAMSPKANNSGLGAAVGLFDCIENFQLDKFAFHLQGAAIGLSALEEAECSEKGQRTDDANGLPDSVSVVLTAQDVLYRDNPIGYHARPFFTPMNDEHD